MSKNNQKQNVEIAEIKKDVAWLKEKVEKIEKAVFNELPHKIDEIKDKLFFGFIVGIASVIIIQIILKFLV